MRTYITILGLFLVLLLSGCSDDNNNSQNQDVKESISGEETDASGKDEVVDVSEDEISPTDTGTDGVKDSGFIKVPGYSAPLTSVTGNQNFETSAKRGTFDTIFANPGFEEPAVESTTSTQAAFVGESSVDELGFFKEEFSYDSIGLSPESRPESNRFSVGNMRVSQPMGRDAENPAHEGLRLIRISFCQSEFSLNTSLSEFYLDENETIENLEVGAFKEGDQEVQNATLRTTRAYSNLLNKNTVFSEELTDNLDEFEIVFSEEFNQNIEPTVFPFERESIDLINCASTNCNFLGPDKELLIFLQAENQITADISHKPSVNTLLNMAFAKTTFSKVTNLVDPSFSLPENFISKKALSKEQVVSGTQILTETLNQNQTLAEVVFDSNTLSFFITEAFEELSDMEKFYLLIKGFYQHWLSKKPDLVTNEWMSFSGWGFEYSENDRIVYSDKNSFINAYAQNSPHDDLLNSVIAFSFPRSARDLSRVSSQKYDYIKEEVFFGYSQFGGGLDICEK